MRYVCQSFVKKAHLNYFQKLFPLFIQSVKYAETSATDLAYKLELEELEQQKQFEATELEKSRNKSRLKLPEYNIMHGKPPYEKPRRDYHNCLKYQRQLYGIYGEASNVDPSICFPTKEELEDIKEYNKVAFPQGIMERRNAALQKLKEEEEAYQEREQHFIKTMERMEEWKKKILERKSEKVVQADEAQTERTRLLEEVRRHFGFKIKDSDERFQFLLEQKEKEQLKQKKLEKKKRKEEMLLAKLAALESKYTDEEEKT